MINVSRLKPFTFYRTKGTMKYTLRYDGQKDLDKGILVSILAPSIHSELDYIAKSHIDFSRVLRIYHERFTEYDYYKTPRKKEINNPEYIMKYIEDKYLGNNNLSNIKTVVNPVNISKANNLRTYNVLYESNNVLDKIIHNSSDNRPVSYKRVDVLNYLREYYSSKLVGQLKDYPSKYIILPVHLWLEYDLYSNPKIFNKNNDNFISMIYTLMEENMNDLKDIFKDFTFILINGNELMKLDFNSEDLVDGEYLKIFLKKSKTNENIIADTVDDDEDVIQADKEETDGVINDKLNNILQNTKINMDDLSEEKKERLKNILRKQLEDNGEMTISEKDLKKIKTSEDMDTVLSANIAGISIDNYKRNQLLKEKYKSVKYKGVPLEELLKAEEKYNIPDYTIPINTINENYTNIPSANFAKAYNDNLMEHDLINILLHFSNTDPGLFLISDIVVEDVSDTFSRLLKYTVEFESTNRKRHKFSFLLPKMYKDRYLFINEKQWDITHQKFPYPLTKITPDTAQFCTNYNKIFISRYGNNVSPKLTKLKKILLTKDFNKIKVVKGDNTVSNKQLLTTIEYDELAKEISRIHIGDYKILLNAVEADLIIGANPKHSDYIPIAVNNKTKINYYLDGTTNIIYDGKDTNQGELSDFIIKLISTSVPKFEDIFNDLSAGTKFQYARATVMAHHIPLILVIAAGNCMSISDSPGLIGVLEKAKINYEFSSTRPNNLDKDSRGVIPFEDGYLIYDRYPYENSLLLNGLLSVPTKEYTFAEMNMRETYISIFDTLYSTRTLIDGIENFYQLMMDPITVDVAERLNYPTTYIESLLYACGLLADNNYTLDSSYDNCRIRLNEIINVYLYQELCTAFKQYRIGRNPKFSIPEDAVIKALMSSQIVDAHTQLNLSTEMENNRGIKSKGPVGLNVDEAYTIEKRAYHDSMVGVVASNTTPSGEVGVKRFLSLNCNIKDARGFIEIGKNNYDGTEIQSPGELMKPFAIDCADAERSAMALSQSKHVVPVIKSSPSLVTLDMGRLAPYLSTDFSHIAKEDGTIETIENDIMIIKYKSGKYEDVDLSEKPDSNSNGGFDIMNQLTTEFKKGDKIKKGDIVAYNPKYITAKDMFGNNIATEGTLARIAIISDGGVFEDSTYVSESLANSLSSYITVSKQVILSQFSNIKYMVKKGQDILANEPLLIFDDTEEEFTSKLLQSMTEDEDVVMATNVPITSKVTGRIADIKIYYTMDEKEMTTSLQKIVKEYTGNIKAKNKLLSKYMNLSDANTILTPIEPVIPDSTGKIKGVQVDNNILIEFYIEYLDVFGLGDKITHYGALKGINGNIIPDKYRAYTESNEDRKIDAYLSLIGNYKRMVVDVFKVGSLSKFLIENKRKHKDKYLERLKKEL